MVTLESLKDKYGNAIPYRELLLAKEWRSKRQEIISQDNNRCQRCNQEGKGYYDFQEIVEEVSLTYNGQDAGSKMSLSRKLVKNPNPTYLHVHHKYYIHKKFPWEYSDDALITVCSECHQKIHEAENIAFYADDSMTEELLMMPCYRCNGVGEFPEYKHVQNGICFRCGGAKFEQLIRDIDRIEDTFDGKQ